LDLFKLERTEKHLGACLKCRFLHPALKILIWKFWGPGIHILNALLWWF
jgi:hypothetical protein